MFCVCFFFKQKTAYEMRISDWSSDVCSSDLTVIASIGQGFVLATPLQLATMTARLVNGGKAVQPHVTLRVGSPESPKYAPPVAPDMEIDPRWLDVVVRGMVAVMEGPRGTGRTKQIPVEGMEMGGKTGTSQVRRITAAERAGGYWPWRSAATY